MLSAMATQSASNNQQSGFHHQGKGHWHQKRHNLTQKYQLHSQTKTSQNIQDTMWWRRKTTYQSRMWKRHLLDSILPINSAIFTTLALIIVLISGNTVHAAQRQSSSKPKEANNLNAISQNGVATSSNLNVNIINNGFRVDRTVSNANGNIVDSSTSTIANTIASSSSTSTAITTISSKNSGGSSFKGSSSNIHRNQMEVNEDNKNGPYFDKAASKNITALLGKTAYLNCRVKNLGNKTMLLQVSWVRHRDIHLLTVGRYTYTSDQRFRAIHQPQTEDWILQIKYPQHRDSGVYECQVSTTPHMSHYIHLNVVEPSTEIIGAPDLYIESGSTINLTCVILNSPEPPAYIFWNHNSAIINYDSPRGGVTVVTNKGETTTSFLLIKTARPSDSGQYQCNPSNSKSKGVTVHVLNGEFPAAMQRAGQAHHQMSPNHCLLVYLSIFLSTIVFIRQYQKIPNVAIHI
ncbi:uncharacterized protein LOC129938368 isoform X2 [Eupeodes corollae]|uniref:uncharacterized protein LOC129938368 isoform X2 n=1 Tax=Eupeodes corollae TaxID=290404 RepID=UPI0024900ED1|nr:uncharacterized protein LOC129938368 isoform X2 [Eupeodes corollae]